MIETSQEDDLISALINATKADKLRWSPVDRFDQGQSFQSILVRVGDNLGTVILVSEYKITLSNGETFVIAEFESNEVLFKAVRRKAMKADESIKTLLQYLREAAK
jgi:hypothetical protein